MKHFQLLAVALALSIPAGFSCALIYPHSTGLAAELLFPAMATTLLVAIYFLRGGAWLALITFSLIASLAGAVTLLWSGLSWRIGLWYPEFPHVLHRIFGTDGESSYNASDGQLFIVVFASLAVLALVSRGRFKHLLEGAAQVLRE